MKLATPKTASEAAPTARIVLLSILGLDCLYHAKAMKVCWLSFKEGQYSISVDLCTEPLNAVLGEKRIRFEAHQKVVIRAVVGKEFGKPGGKYGSTTGITTAMRSAKEHQSKGSLPCWAKITTLSRV